MKTLYLMRHAKSDWKQPGLSDHDRPLNARGRRSAPLIAKQLREVGLTVDAFLASSAIRVQQTVELLRETWGERAEQRDEQGLYLATPDEIMHFVRGLDDDVESAMVVAHNPGMAGLVSFLAQESMEMPTAAVAVFQTPIVSWAEIYSKTQWALQHYWKPRELE